MSESGKQHNKEFKINAVKYIIEHPELTQRQCCKNLGIGLSTLGSWRHEYKQNHGVSLSEALAIILLMNKRKLLISNVNYAMQLTRLMS